VVEVAVALEEAEAARVVHLEAAHAERLRVVEGAPQPLAGREAEEDAVGVVHLGPPVVEPPRRVLAVVEHGGERADAELVDLATEEEAHLDLHGRLLPRRDDEPIGAGHARAVEQREDHQILRAGSRRHEPEFPEPRELLAPRLRRVDREPACRQPEHLVASHRAEVGRAEEDDDFVVVVASLERVVDAEAGVAELLRHAAGELVLAVVELARREAQRRDDARLHDVDAHDAVVEQPRMEELHLERQLPVPPERALGAKADVAPLIVGELEEPVRHLALRLLVRIASQIAGFLDHVLEAEAGMDGRRERDCREQQERGETARGGVPSGGGSVGRAHGWVPALYRRWAGDVNE
jgi:hypothetical protein